MIRNVWGKQKIKFRMIVFKNLSPFLIPNNSYLPRSILSLFSNRGGELVLITQPPVTPSTSSPLSEPSTHEGVWLVGGHKGPSLAV